MEWPPSAEQIPLLPLETLAITILRQLARRSDRPVLRQDVSGVNGILQSLGGNYGHPSIVQAVNEAWDWLFVHGLMVNADGVTWTVNYPASIEGHRVISRKGREILTHEDPFNLLHAERILVHPLHHRIETKARIQFAIGAYGSAVFEAFKDLEVRVRTACGYSNNVVGDSLMRQAFSPDKGPLRDPKLVPGEQRAIMELFAGGIGAFKNPLSHRAVDFDDPTIAAEQLLFADLLHRMLDSFIDVDSAEE